MFLAEREEREKERERRKDPHLGRNKAMILDIYYKLRSCKVHFTIHRESPTRHHRFLVLQPYQFPAA
jgi:hypothetical protein